MATILSANRSNISITIEGQEPQNIEGLQSITYKSFQEREDIAAIGSDQRIDVAFGLKVVRGTLKVKSTSATLNDALANGTAFQLVVNLKSRPGDQEIVHRVTFDQCYLDDKEFQMDVNGIGVTSYLFNATSVREEF
jgi:hypothetical protein